jgi:hypothetical protein
MSQPLVFALFFIIILFLFYKKTNIALKTKETYTPQRAKKPRGESLPL